MIGLIPFVLGPHIEAHIGVTCGNSLPSHPAHMWPSTAEPLSIPRAALTLRSHSCPGPNDPCNKQLNEWMTQFLLTATAEGILKIWVQIFKSRDPINNGWGVSSSRKHLQEDGKRRLLPHICFGVMSTKTDILESYYSQTLSNRDSTASGSISGQGDLNGLHHDAVWHTSADTRATRQSFLILAGGAGEQFCVSSLAAPQCWCVCKPTFHLPAVFSFICLLPPFLLKQTWVNVPEKSSPGLNRIHLPNTSLHQQEEANIISWRFSCLWKVLMKLNI